MIEDYLDRIVKRGLGRAARYVEEDIYHIVNKTISKASRYLVKELAGWTLIIVSCLFIAVAAIFFLMDYLMLNRTLAFLLIGGIMLLAGIIIKLRR